MKPVWSWIIALACLCVLFVVGHQYTHRLNGRFHPLIRRLNEDGSSDSRRSSSGNSNNEQAKDLSELALEAYDPQAREDFDAQNERISDISVRVSNMANYFLVLKDEMVRLRERQEKLLSVLGCMIVRL